MEKQVTKTIKLLETNNDMTHNFYYLIHCKFTNETKTRYRKIKFVLFFDAFDIQEYFEVDRITQKDIKNYVNYRASEILENEDDYNNLDDFIEFCNQTIINYNN